MCFNGNVPWIQKYVLIEGKRAKESHETWNSLSILILKSCGRKSFSEMAIFNLIFFSDTSLFFFAILLFWLASSESTQSLINRQFLLYTKSHRNTAGLALNRNLKYMAIRVHDKKILTRTKDMGQHTCSGTRVLNSRTNLTSTDSKYILYPLKRMKH